MNSLTIIPLIVASIFGGSSEMPERHEYSSPISFEKPFEFRCEEDMPCAIPSEYRESWSLDIDYCVEGYGGGQYNDALMGCLDEARTFWTTMYV